MIDQAIVYLILGLPLLLSVIFRVNASHLFFSLMAGELLGRYFGHDIEVRAQPVITQVQVHGLGEVALILFPMFVTAVFLRKSVTSSRLILHVPLLLITGIICAAFVLPVLPASLQSGISQTVVGGWILELNRIIIGGMVVLQLVGLWIFTKKEKQTKKHGDS